MKSRQGEEEFMMRGSFILNGLTEPNKAKKEEEK